MACIPGGRPQTEYEVDCAIEEWHTESYEVKDSLNMHKLHEWLGWTWDEYAQWVYDGTIPEE